MFLILLFSLFTITAHASEVTTVAIIDTGFGYSDVSRQSKVLCKYGHKDFTGEDKFLENMNTVDPVPKDTHGHGTNVAGLIDLYARGSQKPYCLVILKIYGYGSIAFANSIKAIKYAKSIKATIINYSGGGTEPTPEETKAVTDYLDNLGVFVAAAGNEKKDLAKQSYYPAMSDPRVIVVGNKNQNNKPVPSSNFGDRVNTWEYGSNANGYGVTLTGTSQSTAIATGKIIHEMQKDMILAGKPLQ